jgi:hypothetical protein
MDTPRAGIKSDGEVLHATLYGKVKPQQPNALETELLEALVNIAKGVQDCLEGEISIQELREDLNYARSIREQIRQHGCDYWGLRSDGVIGPCGKCVSCLAVFNTYWSDTEGL